MYLARFPNHKISLVHLLSTALACLCLTSASPIAYSDQKLTGIDRLRASGASEADIAHQYPLLHSSANSKSLAPHPGPLASPAPLANPFSPPVSASSSSPFILRTTTGHPISSSSSSSSSSASGSASADDFWDVVFMWLGFRAPAASTYASSGGGGTSYGWGKQDDDGGEEEGGNGIEVRGRMGLGGGLRVRVVR